MEEPKSGFCQPMGTRQLSDKQLKEIAKSLSAKNRHLTLSQIESIVSREG